LRKSAATWMGSSRGGSARRCVQVRSVSLGTSDRGGTERNTYSSHETKVGQLFSVGQINFDTGLLRQSADFRAKVIVHELLHLKVPNHGPLFKALLKAYLDRYR